LRKHGMKLALVSVLVILSLLVLPPVGVSDISSGAVAYYKMQEGSGSTIADGSGNGNTGIINGASWTTGKYDNALSFDGTNDYVELKTIFYSFYMYVNPGISGSGKLSLYISGWLSSTTNLAAGQWSHVGFVNNPSENTLKLYINGAEKGSFAARGTTALSAFAWIYPDDVAKSHAIVCAHDSYTDRMYIGLRNLAQDAFDGKIDEVRIYNRTFSAADVTELYSYDPNPPQSSDFSLSASPSALSINPGSSGTSTVTVTSLTGFSQAVTITNSRSSATPSGVTVSFNTNPVTPPSGSSANSTITINVDQFSSTGTYTLIITGTAGALTRSTTISLTISGQAGTYAFAVRAGATKITITCTWSNSGSIGISLIQPPSTTYTEAYMAIYERTTINAGATATYNYLKRGELVITALTSPQTWLLQLTPQGVTTYTLNIEVN